MHILYEGPSLIDGGPIFAALTGLDRPSQNIKTGPMLQTWILRSDIKPTDALKTGDDKSVCGLCPHRGTTCYVNVGQAPNNVYKSYIAGNFERTNLKKLGYKQRIRVASYGDGAAIPIKVWDDLLSHASDWTGYTHQPLLSPELKRYCHASADTVEQAELYQNLGWKTFRIKAENEPLQKSEIICPSSKGVQCITCLKCNGTTQNVAIDVHGAQWKINRFMEQYNETETLELQ